MAFDQTTESVAVAVLRTVEVWVNLGNAAGRLRTGGAAEVVVTTKKANDAIVVPASAAQKLRDTVAAAGVRRDSPCTR